MTKMIMVAMVNMTSILYAAPICELEQQYTFPKPTNININMMPFIVGETFQACRVSEAILGTNKDLYWSSLNQRASSFMEVLL